MNTVSHTRASRRGRGALPFLALTMLIGAGALAEETATSPADGAWQQHKVDFQFLGFTSTYSCDGLADKVKVLLLAAGARSDAKSWPGGCASGFGQPDKFARAQLTFYTLAPLDSSASADIKPVKGIWRPVIFSARSPHELQIGDCELVEQFITQVLPLFKTQGLTNSTTCVPHQQSGSTINVKFEAFSSLPAVAGKKTAPGT